MWPLQRQVRDFLKIIHFLNHTGWKTSMAQVQFKSTHGMFTWLRGNAGYCSATYDRSIPIEIGMSPADSRTFFHSGNSFNSRLWISAALKGKWRGVKRERKTSVKSVSISFPSINKKSIVGSVGVKEMLRNPFSLLRYQRYF